MFFLGLLYKHDNLNGTGAYGVLENVGVEDREAARPSGELEIIFLLLNQYCITIIYNL